MQFMVIERFRSPDAVRAVYERFGAEGRLMPDGLEYVSSWIDASFERCFLIAECDDPQLLQSWVLQWNDLIEFEIVPVVGSQETAAVVRAAGERGTGPDGA